MVELRVLIVLGLVATSAAFFRATWSTVRIARLSRGWSVVPAEITHSQTKILGYYRTYRYRPRMDIEVEYVYWVYGERYVGYRHRFSIWRFGSMTPTQAEETIARYPPSAHVTVHYDPQQPAVSVLEPRLDGKAIMTCILFGTMALAAAIWLPLSEIGWLPE